MNNKDMRRTRTVEEKIKSAEAGDLGCLFEVADWYAVGKYSFDEDKAKSNECYNKVREQLSISRPYFSELEVINFKGIREVKGSLRLNPNVNVFVGINGSGKTTLLEAIVKAASWIVNGIRTQGNGKTIDKNEINNNPSSNDCFIKAVFTINDDTDFNLKLFKSKKSSRLTSELAEFKNLSDMYRFYSDENELFCLPLFVHYSVSRSLEVKLEDNTKEEVSVSTKLDAYKHCFDEQKKYRQLVDWLTQHYALSSRDVNVEKEYLKKISEYETIDRIYNSLPDDVKLGQQIGLDMKKDMEDLRGDIKKLESLRDNNDPAVVNVVKEAIYKFMDISNIRVDVSDESVSVLMDKSGVTISSDELSQGEKALFSIVSDISRRLVLLNPDKGVDALLGTGIVTIDEIDLHLHPKWQQDIVIKLSEVFPNIQFILTTHSPQVLSTIPNYCIKALDNDANGVLSVQEPSFSLGSESKMILEEIFLTDSRPEKVREVQKLNRYKALIKEDRWDSDEALTLEAELMKWAGEHDPIMRQLKMDIRLRERRRG
ncbi:chromosome segregation protein SMC [Vibrio owensii]|nr:chromosome segregation protein SMC [Vibrio owensii]